MPVILKSLDRREAWPETAHPLQQSWAYGYAQHAAGARIARYAIHEGETRVGVAQLAIRRLPPGRRFAILFRGPVWLTPAPRWDLLPQIMPILRRRHGRLVALMPEAGRNRHLDQAAQAARLRRVMSGFSTAWVDLRAGPDDLRAGLKGKWRNQLTKAESLGLTIEKTSGLTGAQRLAAAAGAVQRRRGYRALPQSFLPPFEAAAGADALLTLYAHTDNRSEPVAGMLFLIHGRAATYHLGWNGPEGRRCHAHNRLLWAAMLALRARGVEALDLGGIDKGPMRAISHFKLGVGAAPFTLAGTYL